MLNLFKKKKPRVTMKPAPGQCPKCGSHIYRIEGIKDLTLWCTNCGWNQIDYSLNKPSLY